MNGFVCGWEVAGDPAGFVGYTESVSSLHFETLLLPEDGFCRDVRVDVGADGRISAMERDCRPRPADQTVSGPTVPGMPNLHSHAFQYAVAGSAEQPSPDRSGGDDFWTWRERMYAVANAVTPADVQALAAALYVACLEGGYTQVAEFHYLHGGGDRPLAMQDAICGAAEQAGIGCTVLPALYQQRGFDGGACGPEQQRFVRSVEEHLSAIEALLARARQQPERTGGRLQAGLALHSLRAVGPDAMRDVVASFREATAATSPAAPIHIHIAEQTQEVDGCLEWSGKRPVQWLLDNMAVDPRWCLVHATHVDEAEIEGVAERGAVLGICPSTEADLGDGIVPADRYLAAGARIGVGSDQHVVTDAASEIRTLEWSQRLLRQRRCVLADGKQSAALRLWEECAKSGAQACGIPAGVVAVGQRADFVALDDTSARVAGLEPQEVLDHWVFAPGTVRVRDVFVCGDHVVRDGRHTARAEVSDRLSETLRRLRSRV